MFSSVKSQKTITSFFSRPLNASKERNTTVNKPVSKEDTDKKRSQNSSNSESDDSPVKLKPVRRKRAVISSSDEDNRSDSEVLAGSRQSSDESNKAATKRDRQASSSSDSEKPRKRIKTYENRERVRASLNQRKDSPSAEVPEPTTTADETEANDHCHESDSLEPDMKSSKAKPRTLEAYFGRRKSRSPSPPRLEREQDASDDEAKPVVNPKPEDFNPATKAYHPIESACWKPKEKIPYLALAKTLEAIENVSARLKMIEILSNFFRSVIVLTPDDLLCCVYLSLNQLAPAYEGVELKVGETVLIKSIARTTGKSTDAVKSKFVAEGDLGVVAEASRSSQRTMFAPPKLTVRSVYNSFREIAEMTGHSSVAKKTEKIQNLLVACRLSEARYVVRSLGGKLRIGLAEQSLLSALANAVTLTPPGQDFPPKIIDSSKGHSADSFRKKCEENAHILKTAYCECPSYDKIVPVLVKEGIAALPEHCKITPGIPIKPMLAHPTKGIAEVLHRFDKAKFSCEYKYDGERAQIHVSDNEEVRIYSRNQENTTSKYPDVVSRMPKVMKSRTKSFILDSEVVAWNVETSEILPFQVLSTRKRKDAAEDDIKVRVCTFAFDLLYLNGESLVRETYEARRKLLHEHFKELPGQFLFVISKDCDNSDDIAEFLDEAIKNKCEGLMVKTLDLDSTYEIARRSHKWLKLKKDYLDGIGDSLDLVVIGGYYGKGKRAGNYGGFLLACYDEENEEFQTICKLGTGLKDDDLSAHTASFNKHILPSPKSYYRFDPALEPDVWFDAFQVWEIKCADLSVSPVHKAAIGIVDPKKGISLRFPRFVRIRDDKKPEDATNSMQVAKMYENQEQVKHQGGAAKKNNDDEDFY